MLARKYFGVWLAPAAFVAAGALGCGSDTEEETPAGPSDKTVVVLFTSDEHSRLFGFGPELDDHPASTTAGTGKLVGGIARRATILARERAAAAAAGKDTLTVSGGDNQMGALPHTEFRTKSIDYGVMKALGYDVTTLGNHEFDFGPAALGESISAARAGDGMPAVVSSNLHFSDTDTADDGLAAHFSADVTDDAAIHPYKVVTTAAGIRIGVFGYLGPDAEHAAPNKVPVRFSAYDLDMEDEGDVEKVLPGLVAELQAVVDTLREQEKVDLVVALAHAGIADTSSQAGIEKGEDYRIAQLVSGIDLIVSGHEHEANDAGVVATNPTTGGQTLVLSGSAYGSHVGRVEWTIHQDGSPPTWDAATRTLILVDDKTVAEPADVAMVENVVTTLESGSSSYIAQLLTRVEGSPVTDDPSVAGDLYFRPVGQTAFDVTRVDATQNLSTDATLAAADEWGAATSMTTDVALESAGVLRGRLTKGATGVISAADAFNVVPLGFSPTDGSIGYPLVRGYVWLVELRGVIEASLALGPTNNDYNIGWSGIRVEYDATRPSALSLAELLQPDKGKVMRMLRDTDHTDGFDQFDEVIYDREQKIGDDFALYSVVASSYLAQFAGDVGVSMKNAAGKAATFEDMVLTRSDASEIKQVEGFLSYLRSAPGGTLPSLYDVTSSSAATRTVCLKGCP